ncbi:MAG: pyruvate kinase [Pirellulaceae bacterium]|nr:pyruvate kinase [Pirellulaceae bacterium]
MSDLSARPYRHTKIIATIGPSTDSDARLRSLIDGGVDVMRLNMAHGTPQWASEITHRIRRVSHDAGRQVGVMMDVKGPEIRTGAVDQPIRLSAGDPLYLQTRPADKPALVSAGAADSDASDCTARESNGSPAVTTVSVNYPGLADDINDGATILVDSGLLRLRVTETDDHGVHCEVLTPGVLDSRRHINLPGVHVQLPALTEKDKQDLQAGVRASIDFVALSFVRCAADIESLRQFLDSLDSRARIIAKIEEQAGVENMSEIVQSADAIMVARGDLGIEIDYHRLPLIQTELVRSCQAEGKPVIIATHLLESMIHSPMPTRAEISDICNAVREQADAVMLSGETTTGDYPLESVEVMRNIIGSIEPTVSRDLNAGIQLREPKSKMLRSAAVLAQELENSGIIVFTRSGFLAYVLAALRPRGVPIFAFTDDEVTFRQCLLPWGVEPFLMQFSDDPEQTIADAIAVLKSTHWADVGTCLVVITNVLAHGKVVDSLQLRQVEAA